MIFVNNFKKLSYFVYGLGLTGKSVVNFFNKNNIKNFQVWDDKDKSSFKSKRPRNLDKALRQANYIILSPGVSLNLSKNRKKLIKYEKKIITDIDLIFLMKRNFKSIVVTGTNGKSTTCKIIYHLLKKNGFRVQLGGNIGTPILDLDIKKKSVVIIEASSFQLAHSKFILPNYAFLLNITNDQLDWHGSIKNYINSKFKIFNRQKKNHYSFVNDKFKIHYKKKGFQGKLIVPSLSKYKKFKKNIKNSYLNLDINDENMANVFELSKILKLNKKSFIKSLNTFEGLPHRYEIFLKRKNCIFINDSKATSFQATKFALANTKNIYWIVGGLPKKGDFIDIKKLKKNIFKSYIIGKNINFFKRQLQNNVEYCVTKTLDISLKQIISDINSSKKKINNILFSPSSASFDQFLNFEKRGETFKKLSFIYARKLI